MTYSFIEPRSKKLVGSELRLTLIFFTAVSVMLVGLYGFFLYGNSQLKKEKQSLVSRLQELRSDNSIIMEEMDLIEKYSAFGEAVFTSNTIIKDEIKDFFDLIPDSVILDKVVLSPDMLTIFGRTVDRANFEKSFMTPLRSNFSKSSVELVPLENGSFIFKSSSTIAEER
ncbi:MAG: hypothetical protein B5M52_02740 [Helicobacteraceae bacterium 4484_230]|nr:MAG: hypothetical protein B5M52_02740 [Helicobacteraceae bacterium 4484_230]